MTLEPEVAPAPLPEASPEPSPQAEPQGEPTPQAQTEPQVDVKALEAERDRYRAQAAAIQAAKDREVMAERRQREAYEQQWVATQHQQNRQYWESLRQNDPQRFADEMSQSWAAAEQAQRASAQTMHDIGRAIVNEIWNDPEFAELSNEDKFAAFQVAQAAAAPLGRDASATEINRAFVRSLKGKVGAPMQEMKETLKQLQAEVKALRGDKAGETVRSESGPSSPAAPAPARGSLSKEAIDSMDDKEYEARREEIFKWMGSQ